MEDVVDNILNQFLGVLFNINCLSVYKNLR